MDQQLSNQEPVQDGTDMRVACCTYRTNNISIQSLESEISSGLTFPGAQIIKGGGYTYLDKIPETDYLVSLNQQFRESAILEIFDISKKKSKMLYSSGEIVGSTSLQSLSKPNPQNEDVSVGDLSINRKINKIAFLSIDRKINYHLFDYNSLEIVKRVKTPGMSNSFPQRLDFNPQGDRLATLDSRGVCVIHNVLSNEILHICKTATADLHCCCRWNPSFSMISFKVDTCQLEFLDPDKGVLLSNKKQFLSGETEWIEWKQDGYLLAACDVLGQVEVFDIRENRVIRVMSKSCESVLNSVKWDPAGKTLAAVSSDGYIHSFDFQTGKPLKSIATNLDSNLQFYGAESKLANRGIELDMFFVIQFKSNSLKFQRVILLTI